MIDYPQNLKEDFGRMKQKGKLICNNKSVKTEIMAMLIIESNATFVFVCTAMRITTKARIFTKRLKATIATTIHFIKHITNYTR